MTKKDILTWMSEYDINDKVILVNQDDDGNETEQGFHLDSIRTDQGYTIKICTMPCTQS
tara:strand:+ start:268 stop:444 length:177 start_codon:yes stop_codon:yes gene_type:complete